MNHLEKDNFKQSLVRSNLAVTDSIPESFLEKLENRLNNPFHNKSASRELWTNSNSIPKSHKSSPDTL